MFIKLNDVGRDTFVVRVEDISKVFPISGANSLVEFTNGQKIKVSNSVDEIYEMIKDYEK